MNLFNIEISKYLFGLDRYTKRAIAIITDVLLCVIAVWLAFFIRLEEYILLKDISVFHTYFITDCQKNARKKF